MITAWSKQHGFPMRPKIFIAISVTIFCIFFLTWRHGAGEQQLVVINMPQNISYAAYERAVAENRWPTFDEAWNCEGCLQVMQNESEARLMVQQMTPGINVIEYGSGKSTAFLPMFGIFLHSVEHYRPWFEIVRNLIESSPRGDTVHYAFVEPNDPEKMNQVWLEPSQYVWYKDYIRAGRRWATDGIFFDVALVDGRVRPQVAVEVLYLANPDKLDDFLLLLHDYYPLGAKGGERDHYLMVENFYEKVSEAESMTVWKPKANVKEIVANFDKWPEWWCGIGIKPDGRCTAIP